MKRFNYTVHTRQSFVWVCEFTKNANPETYGYSGYGIGFDSCSQFGKFAKNVVTFGVGNNLSVHTNSSKKNKLVLGEEPTDGLNDTIITTEVKYYINITTFRKKTCLS